MSDAGETSVKSLGIFSTLESATEFRFFLLAATFVLLIDDVFIYLNQPGLIELAADPRKLEAANFGLRVVLVFVIFSFLTSLVLKLLAIIVDGIAWMTIGRAYMSIDGYLEKSLGNDRFPQQRKFECVRPLELRREAHMTKDSFYLAQYDEYEQGWMEQIRSMNQYALYAFYGLVLLASNWWLGRNGEDSIVSVISKHLGSQDYLGVLLLGLGFIFLYRIFQKDDPKWIYCPTLYRELETRDEEAKKAFDQFK